MYAYAAVYEATFSCRSNCYFRGTRRRFSPKCIENTFQSIQSTFISLEVHSKRRYKIYICSVILGQLESFPNYMGSQYYFPENFRCNLKFYEVRIFSDSSLHSIFKSEKNLGFLFRQKQPTWEVKCEKLNFRKSYLFQTSFENCTGIGRSSRNFLAFLKLQKILGIFSFSEQIFYRKQLWGAPVISAVAGEIEGQNIGFGLVSVFLNRTDFQKSQ